jgi:CheY-like chemotaxis protein
MPKILLIDDDKDFREVVATKLKTGGFEVVDADDGESGLKKAKEFLPDLILLDVKMPKMDGIAVLLKLKEDPATRDIKIALLTAFGDPQKEIYTTDKRFAKELGAYEYLLKTQDLDEIVDKIQGFLVNH